MRWRTGYTLTELITAVAIIGILAAASVGYHVIAVQRERWDAARDLLLAIYTG